MSTSPNRPEAVLKYFTQTPNELQKPNYSSKQNKMLVGGGLLLGALVLFFYLNGFSALLFGVVMGYIGFKQLRTGYSEYSEMKRTYEKDFAQYERDFARAEPKPPDWQMDQWLKEDMVRIQEDALRKLDLSSEDIVKLFTIGGPDDQKETLYAVGQDGKTRYSHINILIVHLADHKISTYQCSHSLIYGATLRDNTQEFPYREITNFQIKTINKGITIVNGRSNFVRGVQQFALYTSGANAIEVTYSFSKSADSDGELMTIGSDETIKAIRKKIEEYTKKYERS